MLKIRGKKSWSMNRKIRELMILLLLSISAAVLSVPCFRAIGSEETAFNPSVKDMPSNEEIFGWIQDLCRLGDRRPGTEIDHQAAKYILDKFQKFGLENAHLEPVNMPLWTAEKWSLTVNGEEVPCFYISHSYWIKEYEGFSAGPGGIKAEMVYVGEGREKDFRNVDVKGKIVLVDVRFSALNQADSASVAYFSYDPDQTVPPDWSQPNPYSPDNFPSNFARAAKHGAVGFVGILMDYYDRNTFYNELYEEKPCLWPIPGLWLSKSDGARLKARLNPNAPNQATLVLDGKIEPATAYNVIGFLPGRTDDVIMVHSHHDAPWASAVEDASGVSEVLALAKYFGAVPPEQREKTLMFCTLDTHFSMYQGHLALIDEIRQKKMNVIVDICLEHIGKEIVEKDGKLMETGFVEPRGIFVTENPCLISITKQAVEKNRLERTVILPTYTILGVPTDAGDFNRAGFTIISLISPPLYIYDPADTPDKVAKDQLNPVATAFADLIESIDQTPTKVVSKRAWIPRYRFQYYAAAVNYIMNMIKE
jgi:hypothetical protein